MSPTRELPHDHAELRKRLEETPALWLPAMAAQVFTAPMADFHREFWGRVWECTADHTPAPVLFALFRGGGKSTSAEVATLALGLMGRRRYAVYLCGTQRLADDHLGSIETLWASNPFLQTWYPDAAPRMMRVREGLGKGRATWARNRLTFGNGYVIDALGLDSSLRGAKIGDARPDLIVLDEFDDVADSRGVTAQKMRKLTTSVLPMAAAEGALVVGVQNLIRRGSIMAQLCSNDPPALRTARVIGPVPMVEGAEWGPGPDGQRTVVGGRITWPARYDWRAVQAKVATEGESAFRSEELHDLTIERTGALWTRALIGVRQPPPLDRAVVAVDPAGTGKEGSDETGIVGIGAAAGVYFVLADRSGIYPAATWAEAAVRLAQEIGASVIAYESNGLGDAGTRILLAAAADLGWSGDIIPSHATKAKDVRAEPIVRLYRDGRVWHARSFPELEDEQCGWIPGVTKESPNRLDAAVWGLHVIGAEQLPDTEPLGSVPPPRARR